MGIYVYVNFISTGDFIRIFTHKLVTYLSTGNVLGLYDALFSGSCRGSRVGAGIPVI